MYLIPLKHLKEYSGKRCRGNPYLLKKRRSDFAEGIITSFLGLTEPFFRGEYSPEPEEISPVYNGTIQYIEWELNQSWVSLVINDLTTLVGKLCSFISERLISNHLVSFEIFIGMEEITVTNRCNTFTGNKESHKGSYTKSASPYLILNEAIWIRLIYFNELVSDRKHSATEKAVAYEFFFHLSIQIRPSCVKTHNISFRYRIRGPSFIKNLLSLLADERN
jgi:hypothetical protein